MESPGKSKQKQKQLDGAATSRSGRLRKKSSKLADFESSEEIDLKHKKISPDKSLKSPNKLKTEDELDADLSDFDDIDIKEEDDWDLPDDDSSFLQDFRDDPDLEGLTLPARELEFDMDEDFDEEAGQAGGVAQSLYLSEKTGASAKKAAQLKEGHNPKKKAQRKDKGKSRFTAYMLWARDVRPEITDKHPELDFSSINKKLGELWQLVPTTQKYNWKRRAKRLAVRLRQGGMISTGRTSNRATTTTATTTATTATTKHTTTTMAGGGSGGRGGKKSSPSKGGKGNQEKGVPSRSSGRRAANGNTSPSGFKVTGTAAIDVAAHMKLLGESLNNIGHKLREHEGQIAVSGSLSVLLDSMLCVLGPLMCLTDQLEETRGSIDPATHSAILDNIAYIMPGIV